jgi:hypothetical protein
LIFEAPGWNADRADLVEYPGREHDQPVVGRFDVHIVAGRIFRAEAVEPQISAGEPPRLGVKIVDGAK